MSREGLELDISICDTGHGIPDEVMDQLFQPFMQGSMTTKRLYGGTGLGLSISHSLVMAMGGSISVDTDADSGTCFEIVLPFAQRMALSVPGLPDDEASRPRVVVIDPQPMSRIGAQQALLHQGMQCIAAESFDAVSGHTDIDIWVVCVPAKLDRHEILRTLGHIRKVSSAPICILHNSSEDDVGDLAHEVGLCCVAERPVRHLQLEAVVRGCLEPGCGDREASSRTLTRPDDSLQGRTFIVADDNPINLRMLSTLLGQFGATSLEAENGEAVLRLLDQEKVDLVFMDVHMPGMNGIDTARNIRAQSRFDDLPLVAVTADIGMEQGSDELDQLFVDYLIKPIEEARLLDTIADCLQISISTASASSPVPVDRRAAHRPPIRDLARALRISGGSEEIAEELLDLLLQTLPETLADLQEAYSGGDFKEMRELLHKLGGAVSVCAVTDLETATRNLHASVTARDAQGIATGLGRLQEEADRLVASRGPRPRA